MKPSGLVRVTPPAQEPITLGEAKAHARIDAALTAFDSDLQIKIAASRETVERETGRALLTQTWRASYSRFPRAGDWFYGESASSAGELYLPYPPLQAVTSIEYVDTGGTLRTMPPEDYQVDTDAFPGRVAPAYTKVWPATRRVYNAVRITYLAGYKTPELVPADLRQLLAMIVSYAYANRGDMAVDLPDAIKYMLQARSTGNYE